MLNYAKVKTPFLGDHPMDWHASYYYYYHLFVLKNLKTNGTIQYIIYIYNTVVD